MNKNKWAEKDPEEEENTEMMMANYRVKNKRKDYHQKLFKTPKEIAVGYITIGEYKAKYTIMRLVVLSIVAGVFVAFGAFVALSASTVFMAPTSTVTTTTTTTPITSSSSSTTVVTQTTTGSIVYISTAKKLVFGLTFPVGLLLIVIYGGDLFTGNVMTMTIGLLCRTVTLRQALQTVTLTYFGNMAGTAAVAGFLAYFTDTFESEVMRAGLDELVMGKVSLSWEVAFLKGVGCNLLVCLAIFCSTSAEEMAGKVLICYSVISAMVLMSYEHSVANTFLIPLGLMYGTPTNFGNYLSKNLIPVTIGNIVGGMLLASITFYLYLWGEYVALPEKAVPHLDGRRIPVRNEFASAFHWLMRKYREKYPLKSTNGGDDEDLSFIQRLWKKNLCSCFYHEYSDVPAL